jgi:HEAT repeat protein
MWFRWFRFVIVRVLIRVRSTFASEPSSMRSLRAHWFALALFGSASFSGCANSEKMATWLPWHEPDQTADLAKYGPISRQKIEQLQTLSKQLPAADAAEHERVSAELAEQIQHESDPLVRMYIVRTLSRCNTPLAAALLNAGLRDPDTDVRVECCKAWGRRRGPDASRVLGEALASDTNVDVRIAATKALGEMRDPQAVPLLAVALDDPDPALQFRAVQAMRLASGKDLGNDVNRWREFAKNPDANAPDESVAGRLGRMF